MTATLVWTRVRSDKQGECVGQTRVCVCVRQAGSGCVWQVCAYGSLVHERSAWLCV